MFKNIKVSEDLHKQVKIQAAIRGMSIIDYIKYLVDLDKDK